MSKGPAVNGALRSATASVSVTLSAAAAAYDVAIAPVSSASAFDPSRPLQLSCTAALLGAPSYDVPYEWVGRDYGSASFSAGGLVAATPDVSAPLQAPSVLLPPGSLTANHVYGFTCCTPNCTSPAGSASLTVTAKLAPSSGALAVTYDTSTLAVVYGVAQVPATTVITLLASGFVPDSSASSSSVLCYQVRALAL